MTWQNHEKQTHRAPAQSGHAEGTQQARDAGLTVTSVLCFIDLHDPHSGTLVKGRWGY